jgi:triosephosphate isomerase
MSKKLIIANWKMNPESLAQANQILESIDGHLENMSERTFSLVLCPPFIFLEEVAKMLSASRLGQSITLGAQDIALEDSGSFTGEISGPMLAGLGVRYAIIGHSERRWKMGESNAVVNSKLKAALRNNLSPIVCLGERERDAKFKDFLRQQVQETFVGLSQDEKEACIIAYEPVWAISTTPGARPDSPEGARESMAVIREMLPNIKVLYGGSITSVNARDFLSQEDMDGVLVGGASVHMDEFIKILTIAAALS